MQEKSKLNVSVGDRRNAPSNDQPAEEFSIDAIPVHTMKRDLEMIKNPSLIRQESAPGPTPSNPRSASSPLPPKTSPFLEKSSQSSAIFSSPKKPESLGEIKDKAPSPKALLPEIPESSEQNTLKKIFVFSVIFLSAIALGVGSYYFWLVRSEQAELPAEEKPLIAPAPIETPAAPTAVVEPETKAEPEVKKEEPEKLKENVITLDWSNPTPAGIKTAIRTQIEKLPPASLREPVEFKIRDSQNNPIAFASFAQKGGLLFAQKLSAYLGESFSLLAFSDGINLGTGLLIESKNDQLLSQGILKEELNLPKELDIIFLTERPKEAKKVSFADFSYKDITLRYFNLISQEKLSVDYAVAKNKLIIGTTRKTFTALYDWLALKPSTN